jgi:hypothetical protein
MLIDHPFPEVPSFYYSLRSAFLNSCPAALTGHNGTSVSLLSRGSNTAPAPRLIPAENKNQPRSNIESGTANAGTSSAAEVGSQRSQDPGELRGRPWKKRLYNEEVACVANVSDRGHIGRSITPASSIALNSLAGDQAFGAEEDEGPNRRLKCGN